MTAEVIRAFRHTNTGRTWLVGETFEGDAGTVEQLAAMGYVAATGEHAGADLAALTVAELRALSSKLGVEAPPRARKAELLALLEAEG